MKVVPRAPLGVVTVSYNSSAVLGPFLDSLRAVGTTPVEVVIVDNASQDIANTEILASSAGARIVALPDNRGYGAAVNAGVAYLAGRHEWVLISNPDITLHPGALDALVDELRVRPEAGVAGPAILEPDGTLYPSARNLPSLRTGVGHALFAGPFPKNPWTRRYRAEREASDEPRAVGWLSGSCLLVRTAAFTKIGGFDEGYFMYFEDVDLGRRMGQAGFSNLYVPSAQATHLGGHSTKADPGPMIHAHHVSAARYVSIRYSSPALAPLRLVIRVGLRVRELLIIRRTARRR